MGHCETLIPQSLWNQYNTSMATIRPIVQIPLKKFWGFLSMRPPWMGLRFNNNKHASFDPMCPVVSPGAIPELPVPAKQQGAPNAGDIDAGSRCLTMK